MLGTIEDLERDIERFQNNVAASSEMCSLLSQILEQIKQQNISFDSRADGLITRLDGIPASLDAANAASNASIKKNVSDEMGQAVRNFAGEQSNYLQVLEQMRQKVQIYIEQSKKQVQAFEDRSSELIEKVGAVPDKIKANTTASLADHRSVLDADIERRNRDFIAGQSNYLRALEQIQRKIEEYIGQSQRQVQTFEDRSAELAEKVAAVPDQIKVDTKASLEDQRAAFDTDIEKRNMQFAEIQQRYVATMEETTENLKHCEDQLLNKYQEFLQTLEKTNLSNLYEQNQKLQNDLNKRTMILMVISAVSVVLGIVGLIL